jgi:hypothetical protein
VIFEGAVGKFTRAVGAATNQMVFTLSANNMTNMIDANAGKNNVDLAFNIKLEVSGTTQLQPRTIAASNVDLVLNSTGNGTISYGNYGNVLVWTQNGTVFRANYYRNDASADNNQWYKFSNTSGAPVNIEVRYRSNDGTTVSDWVQNGTPIPSNGVLTFSKADIENLIPEVGAGTIGWLEFRLHTSRQNCTGIVNAKMNGSFFNVPMNYLDTTFFWGGGVWR